MADLTGLTDAQLVQLHQQATVQAAPDAATAPAATPLSNLSDSELADLRKQAVMRDTVASEIERSRKLGIPVDYGYARRVVQGMTLGSADEIMAGLSTPLEMISRRTLNPVTGYQYAKEREDQLMSKARADQGMLGTAAEIAGGVGSGIGLARNGLTATRLLPNAPGMAGRFLTRPAVMGAEGAAYGGVQGFNDGGNSLDERLTGATKGAAIGGVTGAAIPLVASAGALAAGPVISGLRAWRNPQGAAVGHVARAIDETGRPVGDVTANVQQAAAEGQPEYTLADEIGIPGQQLLRTATSAGGPGRTQAQTFLEQRQAGQSRRVANTLAEGFDAPTTAAQQTTALENLRETTGNTNYGAARNAATPVDVTPAIQMADNYLTPGVNAVARPLTDIADNSIEAVVRRARSLLTDGRSVVSDFNQAFNAKVEIDHLIETGSKTQQRILVPIRNALDDQLAAASGPYAHARDVFRRQSQDIGAVDTGRDWAMRGRPEDTVPAFRAMPPSQQAAARVGYADPLIEQARSSPMGTNAARPLTSSAFRDEAAAMMPMSTGNLAMRRLGREQTMFETRNTALGGSRTDMNLAGQKEHQVDPHLMMDIVTGNVPSLGHRALASMANGLTGYTPAVRAHVADMLLQRGTNPKIEGQIALALARMNRTRAISRLVGSGALAGAATARKK